MKFSLDQSGTMNIVGAFGPGAVRIGERTYTGSLVVTATTIIAPWRPRSMADLDSADLEPVLALHPGVLLIGSGARQSFPEPALLRRLYESRLGFEVMDTAAACRTYNVLVAEGRDVAAALIVE